MRAHNISTTGISAVSPKLESNILFDSCVASSNTLEDKQKPKKFGHLCCVLDWILLNTQLNLIHRYTKSTYVSVFVLS